MPLLHDPAKALGEGLPFVGPKLLIDEGLRPGLMIVGRCRGSPDVLDHPRTARSRFPRPAAPLNSGSTVASFTKNAL